jgi:predicted esterase
MPDIHVQAGSSSEPECKRAPDLSIVDERLIGTYQPSDTRLDANLLVLLHGLGDTQEAFFRLGRSLNLAQTAVLALRAPFPVPLLDGAYQWTADSFDTMTGDGARAVV